MAKTSRTLIPGALQSSVSGPRALFAGLNPLHPPQSDSSGNRQGIVKHPIMSGRENQVKEVLENPDEIRRSRSDNDVYLFYKLERHKRWICAIVRRLNGDGFLITTYPTDAIKEGKQLWPK